MLVGKFKGNQDTAVLDSNELRELLEMSDHQKVVSSEGLVISDKDLKALLDRSDLCTKVGQSKQQQSSQSKRNRNCGLFRVLDNTTDSWTATPFATFFSYELFYAFGFVIFDII